MSSSTSSDVLQHGSTTGLNRRAKSLLHEFDNSIFFFLPYRTDTGIHGRWSPSWEQHSQNHFLFKFLDKVKAHFVAAMLYIELNCILFRKHVNLGWRLCPIQTIRVNSDSNGFHSMKNIADKIFTADKPGRMNPRFFNFNLLHGLFIKSSAHYVQHTNNKKVTVYCPDAPEHYHGPS